MSNLTCSNSSRNFLLCSQSKQLIKLNRYKCNYSENRSIKSLIDIIMLNVITFGRPVYYQLQVIFKKSMVIVIIQFIFSLFCPAQGDHIKLLLLYSQTCVLYNDHPWDQEKVVVVQRWSLFRGSNCQIKNLNLKI